MGLEGWTLMLSSMKTNPAVRKGINFTVWVVTFHFSWFHSQPLLWVDRIIMIKLMKMKWNCWKQVTNSNVIKFFSTVFFFCFTFASVSILILFGRFFHLSLGVGLYTVYEIVWCKQRWARTISDDISVRLTAVINSEIPIKFEFSR